MGFDEIGPFISKKWHLIAHVSFERMELAHLP